MYCFKGLTDLPCVCTVRKKLELIFFFEIKFPENISVICILQRNRQIIISFPVERAVWNFSSHSSMGQKNADEIG